jgi:hypothetical protein
LEIKNPEHVRVESDGENSLDGSNPDNDDGNHRLALREWHRFEEYKKQRYIPKIKYGRALSKEDAKGRTIILGIGPVETRGSDLPSGHNLADYLDKKGRFNNIRFFYDHKERFPNLFHIIQ